MTIGVKGFPTRPRTFSRLTRSPSASREFTITVAAWPLSPVVRAISAFDSAPACLMAVIIKPFVIGPEPGQFSALHPVFVAREYATPGRQLQIQTIPGTPDGERKSFVSETFARTSQTQKVTANQRTSNSMQISTLSGKPLGRWTVHDFVRDPRQGKFLRWEDNIPYSSDNSGRWGRSAPRRVQVMAAAAMAMATIFRHSSSETSDNLGFVALPSSSKPQSSPAWKLSPAPTVSTTSTVRPEASKTFPPKETRAPLLPRVTTISLTPLVLQRLIATSILSPGNNTSRSSSLTLIRSAISENDSTRLRHRFTSRLDVQTQIGIEGNEFLLAIAPGELKHRRTGWLDHQ